MEYHAIFRTLQQFKVNYLVCGGLAVNIYGIPRMTADIDLLLEFDEKNVTNFENAVRTLNYHNSIPLSLKNLISPEDRKKIKSEKNLIAYSFYNSIAGYMNLDVLLDTPFEFSELWERRVIKQFHEAEVLLVGVTDLIEMKKYANRAQDQDDVKLLSKLLK